MFFWVGLAVVLLVVAGLVAWGVSGIGGRSHEPGTQYLFRPGKNRSKPTR
jgi:hypothetical protein